jgi:hypothetical protein
MSDDADFHGNRLNLAVHTLMVPVFVLSALAVIGYVIAGRWLGTIVMSVGPVLSLALQRFGHRKEAHVPILFEGPGDFLGRVFAEPFLSFPVFVLSGEWKRAWAWAGHGH